MKENKENKATEMPENITVRAYLTYAEIENIAEQVAKFQTWAEREFTIDIMLLNYATDIPTDRIEAIGHDAFVENGTMDGIREKVKNFNKIYEAIDYTESTQRALAQIIKDVPDMLKPLKEMQEKYAQRKE